MKKLKFFMASTISAFLLLSLTYCTKTEEVIVETFIRDTLSLAEMLKDVNPKFFDPNDSSFRLDDSLASNRGLVFFPTR